MVLRIMEEKKNPLERRWVGSVKHDLNYSIYSADRNGFI